MQKTSQSSFSSKLSSFNNSIKKFFFLDSSISTRRKVFNSLWAILLGLLVSSIPVLIIGKNPLEFFKVMFVDGFTKNTIELMYLFVVYAIASIGVGFAFKTGLFNIGVSGQMMMAGIIAIVIILHLGTSFWVVLFAALMGILAAFILASIAGAMKTFLNVHEVVTTILLNWTVVYLGIFTFKNRSYPPFNSSYSESGNVVTTGIFDYRVFYIIAVVLTFIIAAGVWFTLKYSALGYKIKMNGLNKDASNYAGVNKHLTTILSMGFSGALAGLAGFIFFVIYKKNYEFSSSAPIGAGFDTIAISLLGLNSPIGILFSSIFYGTMQNSEIILQLKYLDVALKDWGLVLIQGIIIYTAALSQSFSKFRPLEYFWKLIALRTQKWYMEELKAFKEKQRERKNNYLKLQTENKANYAKHKNDYKKLLAEIKNVDKLALEEVGKNKNLTSKEIEQIFQNASKKKLELGHQLNDLGYYEIGDLKNVYYAQKQENKKLFAQKQDLALERFNFFFKEFYWIRPNENKYSILEVKDKYHLLIKEVSSKEQKQELKKQRDEEIKKLVPPKLDKETKGKLIQSFKRTLDQKEFLIYKEEREQLYLANLKGDR